DMEGVAGISVWEQVNGGAALYEEGRRLYTAEVNAAVRGAKRAGATEIVVIDGHGAGGPYSFKSLLPERLESGAEYVLGYTWARYIDPLTAGCDASLFVGAHAMAEACEKIEAGVHESLSSRNWPKPLKFTPPVRFEVELASPERANEFAGRIGVEVLDPRRVVATGDTFWEAWDHFWPR